MARAMLEEAAPVAAEARARRRRPAPAGAIATGLAALLFWLAYDNGSFTLVSRTSVAILVWWVIGVGVALGLWPRVRPATPSLAVTGVLGALAAWTAASLAWAANEQDAFEEVTRTLLYLGIFVLVVLASQWIGARAWADAVALALGAIAVVSLVSRLFPGAITGTSAYGFLPFGQTRLNYPVGYWNGLAILVMLAVPFLLRLAIAGRPPVVRAVAVAVLPAVAAVAYLASSRGGFATGAVGILAFLGLTRRRIHTLAALAVGGAASAAAILVLHARPAVVDHPGTAAAGTQGHRAALFLFGLALAAALVYVLVDTVLRRHQPTPRWEYVALAAVGVAVVVAVVAAHPRQRFEEFKRLPVTGSTASPDYVKAHLLSTSGNGRWQYWQAAYHEFRAHPLDGGGAGSFAEWWLQDRPIATFALDAHSLYLESFGELGVVGGALVLALALAALFVAVQRPLRAVDPSATAAALGAATIAYLVAAGIDWMWELTVVTVVGLIAFALLASRPFGGRGGVALPVALRGVIAAVAAGVIVVEAIPLLATERLHSSQAAVQRGDAAAALADARGAGAVEPWAYAPYLQLALVREQLGELRPATTAIDAAIRRASQDWQLWLVRARLEAKRGNVAAARAALARIRALNPLASLPASP